MGIKWHQVEMKREDPGKSGLYTIKKTNERKTSEEIKDEQIESEIEQIESEIELKTRSQAEIT